MKNVINKSFEINDYAINDSQINGFWMTLLDKETLTTEIIYSPDKDGSFNSAETKRMIHEITKKCDSFRSLMPENINCEVIFKDLDDLTYVADEGNFQVEYNEMDELRVVYRFHIEYYI
ncbi:Hypothetical protein Mbur_0763 [Methanococcoides burtonii DSM 6242]|uniref:Uncharacterized protein n=1 Tax=Methanococcoides burtonii (strain DSM 6242 / NBRC 107633 / OCM 468 / ACE-M) TaxID=259564 RepID=Q12XV2_METBU|nr:Hypothetical protein Mbur_0763 [Methanococcoides burtonii DSM 6242]